MLIQACDAVLRSGSVFAWGTPFWLVLKGHQKDSLDPFWGPVQMIETHHTHVFVEAPALAEAQEQCARLMDGAQREDIQASFDCSGL